MFRTIRKKIFRLAFVSGAGAAASYFFDKDKGDERRAQVKERANGLMGKSSAGGSWQAQTERSANGFEPTVVPPSASSSPAPPAPAVPTAGYTPAPADITDTLPGTASPTTPLPGT
jgi:hypothetical protein